LAHHIRIAFLLLAIALLLLVAPAVARTAAAPASTLQPAAATATLPTGQDSYRIAVTADGIYELTYEDFQNAGMQVAAVNPHTFAMMYRGEPVAYQLTGDGDATFEPGEAVRFYGWAFDGPRSEEQVVTENVFWLWPNGAPLSVGVHPSSTAEQLASSFQEEITVAPKYQYTTTGFDEADWAAFPNEPDAWYWETIRKTLVTPATVHTITRTIALPHPAPDPAADSAQLTVELLTSAPVYPYGDVMVSMGPGYTHEITTTWPGPQNGNIVLTLPATALQDGENPVRLTFYNHQANLISYFLNRFTASYPRQFIAVDDQLIFDGDPASPRRYAIANFSQGNVADPIIWEIGDRRQPRAVLAVNVERLSENDSPYRLFLPLIRTNEQTIREAPAVDGIYRYSFSSDVVGGRFIATNTAGLKTPAAISKYTAPSLDPPGGAEWLAITHPNFMPAAQTLAAHRAQPDFGDLQTAVVSIEDVINQYGYGLPLPDAIRAYLAHALATWDLPPRYVLLVGDATVNPHHATCDGPNDDYVLCDYWSDDAELNYIPTHLRFIDRFQGHIPTDYPNALLVGDDLIPDVALGRLAVQTLQEANNIVAKIIAFETAQLNPGADQRSLVFLADNPDSGGNFIADSAAVAALIPPPYSTTLITRTTTLAADVELARYRTREAIHEPNGAAVLNYRGHGSVFAWGDNIFRADNPDLWPWPPTSPWSDLGSDPLVLLSLDCLDGNFIYPGRPALSETYHALPDTGTVAHWSSTGLGYSFEHNALHTAFYQAIFDHGLLAIGDAINYAKANYPAYFHDSELYSFTLQGDPAMRIWRLDLYPIWRPAYLPLITSQ
jgi:hypothetical protein